MSEGLTPMVLCVVTKAGRTIVAEMDHHTSVPAGFTLTMFQRIRARRAAACAFVREMSAPLLAESIGDYEAVRHLEAVEKDGGVRIAFYAIGHDAEEAEAAGCQVVVPA